MLAFLVTDPRREGDSTEITAVLSNNTGSFHKDIQIPEWDSMGGNPGTFYGEHYERIHFKPTSEHAVLWVWVKGDYHGGEVCHMQARKRNPAFNSRCILRNNQHIGNRELDRLTAY
ncbi:hypothetical protein OAH23_06485 [Verrucomicrobia bacterium]|nr:hypothetical protein [Verrucomicrobiota bacterium]